MARNNFINAESLIEQLTAAFKKHEKAIEESADALNKLDKQYSKLPSEYIKSQKDLISLNIQRSKSEKEVQNALRAKSMAEAAAIRTSETNRKAIDAQNKSLEREQRLLLASQNLYNKTQQQLNAVQAAYNNLAVKKERYNNLTDQEEKRLATLGRVTEKYNATLKAVDATVGKHTRNVGNYASGFNPLSNSINQLSREMPAFANSVQTGFMAISNNLPIFFDAISNTQREIKALRAEGQQVPGLFKQLTASLFSWGTALSVGVTLLTLYGKEMTEWIAGLFDANSALEELTERQKEFGKAKLQGRKDAVSEIVELRKYLSVVKDRNVSDEERNIALKQLRLQYPFYFKNLTNEQILNGKSAEAVDKLNIALEKRKEVEKKSELTTLNKQKLIDLEVEKELQEDLVKVTEQRLKMLTKRDFIRPEALAAAAKDETKAKEKLANINRQINAITAQTLKNDSDIFKLKKETIALEYQEEKRKKEKKQRELDLADVPASEFALMQAILNSEIENNQKIYENDRKTNEDRAKSFEMLMLRRKQLADLEMEEEIRLENKANAVLLAQKGLSEAQKKDIIEQNNINIQKIEFDHAQKVFQITEDTTGKIKALFDKVSNQARINIIDQEELDNLRQLNLLLANLNVESDLSRYKNAEKIKAEIHKSASEKRIENELRNINAEIEGFDISKDNIEKLNSLQNQRIAKEKELATAVNNRLTEEAEKTKQLILNTKAYFQTIQDGFLDKSGLGSLNFFLSLDENGKSTFDKLIAGAQTTGEKIAIAFNGMAEVAQEVFSFINQQQEIQYQASVNRLMSEKETAIKFAGESATAKEEIERQYEERRRQLERRKAKQARDTAIFNIIIDTAQAVVGALAEQNYAGAVLFGLLGAAQLALVSSTPVPAYADGTENHSGGAMLINDGKGTNYKETVVTPDGKAKQYEGRNVLTSAPKGTKVFTHDQWQEKLNAMLTQQNIGFSASVLPKIEVNNNGLTKEDLNAGINKLASVIQNNESIQIIRDAKGERMFKKERGQRIEMLNSRLSIKSFSIKP